MKDKVSLAAVALSLCSASAAAQATSYPEPLRQIAAAVSPLPVNMQAGAKVLGYNPSGKLVTLRKGSNDMVCISDDPSQTMFHVACYHNSLEPFMARGRELHARKLSREAIDSLRLADIKSGRYKMPARAGLYQYFAPRDSVDAASGVVNGASYLYVVYMPYITTATTGLTSNPIDGGPWIMYPGKPWAHIMIEPQKTARVTPK